MDDRCLLNDRESCCRLLAPVESLAIDLPPVLSGCSSVVEIRLGPLARNLEVIRRRIGERKVLGIVKKNAYGHGLEAVARHLVKAGIDSLGVIHPSEGVRLRQAGVDVPVVVLGGTLGPEIEICLRHDLQFAVLSADHLEVAAAVAETLGKRAAVHLKIDTGLGRLGTPYDACSRFLEAAISSKHCRIAGIFSHLACADLPGQEFTFEQIRRFKAVLQLFESLAPGLRPLAHLANSGGILNYPDSWFDLVRPGHILYGVYPDPRTPPSLPIEPVLSLHSKVIFSKRVPAGTPIGYGSRWRAERETGIATVPVGYGDGYLRSLSDGGRVLIRGASFPIVGGICMDQIMIETGSHQFTAGEPVVVIGCQGVANISAGELAQVARTVPDHLLCGLDKDVPRTYIP